MGTRDGTVMLLWQLWPRTPGLRRQLTAAPWGASLAVFVFVFAQGELAERRALRFGLAPSQVARMSAEVRMCACVRRGVAALSDSPR